MPRRTSSDPRNGSVGGIRSAEANIVRGAPHGPERTARIREELSVSDALPFVALRPGVVGMALAEPGRLDDGAGELDGSLGVRAPLLARKLYERAGMTLTGKTAPLRSSLALQYESSIGTQPA